MQDSTPPPANNPLATLLAEAISIAGESPRTRAALRALLAPEPTPERVDAAGIAKALGVSGATVSRLTRDGMPHELVGSRRRYDVAACRAWLTARGPVTAPKNHVRRVPDDSAVDISTVPGLRRVGGAR
jgi:hypothetical protein